MEGKVLGIPLAIIVFVFLLGIIIGIPMVAFHGSEMRELRTLRGEVAELVNQLELEKMESVQASPSATPTETPSPTSKPRVVRPTATVTPTQ